MSTELDLLIQLGHDKWVLSDLCTFHDRSNSAASQRRHEGILLWIAITNRTDGDPFLQYYALATGAILFYDYFLTLADEVCRNSPSNSLQFCTETTFRR